MCGERSSVCTLRDRWEESLEYSTFLDDLLLFKFRYLLTAIPQFCKDLYRSQSAGQRKSTKRPARTSVVCCDR